MPNISTILFYYFNMQKMGLKVNDSNKFLAKKSV